MFQPLLAQIFLSLVEPLNGFLFFPLSLFDFSVELVLTSLEISQEGVSSLLQLLLMLLKVCLDLVAVDIEFILFIINLLLSLIYEFFDLFSVLTHPHLAFSI